MKIVGMCPSLNNRDVHVWVDNGRVLGIRTERCVNCGKMRRKRK